MIKKSHRKIIAKLTCINNNIFLCKFHILNGEKGRDWKEIADIGPKFEQ